MQLSSLREQLLAERQVYERQVADIDSSGPGRLTYGEQSPDSNTITNHPGDQGSEMFEREKEMGLRSGFMKQITEIDEALFRMTEGSYGICEDCGQPIPVARLEAAPSATTCISCKERRESSLDIFHRPVEEQVLNPPFGRTFRDDSEDPSFDGEDCLQEVLQYGTSETPQDVPGAVSYRDLYHSDEQVYGIVDPMDGIVGEDGEVLQGVAVPEGVHVFTTREFGWEEGGAILGELAEESDMDGDGYVAMRALAEEAWRSHHRSHGGSGV
jgi:YteA family regulatory protein